MNTSNYTKPTELEDFENIILRKKNENLLLNSQVPTLDTKSLDTSIYHSILKKTTLFRENFLVKPKKILESFIPKKLSLVMFKISFFHFVSMVSCFSIAYFLKHNSSVINELILFFGFLFLLAISLGNFLALIISLKEFLFSKRQNLLKNIQSFNSIEEVVHFYEKSALTYLNESLLITDTSQLKEAIETFRYLSSEELKSLLALFSKEESSIIEKCLSYRFDNNKINSFVLDDFCHLCNVKIKEAESLLNNTSQTILYQDFISEHREQESQESIVTYDFKAIL